MKQKINKLFSKLNFVENKNKFYKFFINIKKTVQNNKEISSIMKKYYNRETITEEENKLLKRIIIDNLKLVGVGTLSILTFPIPGSTFFVLFLIKGAKKFNIDLMPSEFRKINESFNNDDLIDITKFTQSDWYELQRKVVSDCFVDVDLKVLPVKLSTNKRWSGIFRYKQNRLTREIIEPFFGINKITKWTKEKLYNVMAHEIIHYYLATKGLPDNHGYNFIKEMRRINDLNIGYKVTLKDDEFEAVDDLDKVQILYFYTFNHPYKNNLFFSSSNDKLVDINKENLINRDITSYDLYKVTKKTEISYGLKNSKKLNLYSFRNTKTKNDVINADSTIFIKHVELKDIKEDVTNNKISNIKLYDFTTIDNSEYRYFTTSNDSKIPNKNTLGTYYKVINYDVYELTEKTASKYMLSNKSKFNLFAYKNRSAVDNIKKEPGTKLINYVKIDI